MGMVSTKVTRRVAIGSIAVGLGGAALVLRALKGRYNVNVPEGKYTTEWEEYVKLIDVPIKEIEGPTTVTLNYRPDGGMKSKVVLLDASYYTDSRRASYPAPPSCYTVTTGKVTSVSPVVEDKPALLIHVDGQAVKGRTFTKKEAGGKCILVPHNGELDFFENGHSTPRKIPLAGVKPGCAGLAIGITFGYPKGKSLAKGKKWTIPETSHRPFAVPCELVGFATVAGRETAKIIADAKNKTATYHFTVYVDLTTGIVVRQEVGVKVAHSELVAEQAISQVFES